MTKQWQELKETITEMRDNSGTGTQQEVCKFLANYMEILEKQMQQPCDDCISRQVVLEQINCWIGSGEYRYTNATHYLTRRVQDIPPVTPRAKIGRCKDCKYFEYDSMAKVNGIPLIVVHEICSRWGNGYKTKEDGYCFLFEPQESEDKE